MMICNTKMLDLDKKIGKSWQPAFNISLFKRNYRKKRDLPLKQKSSRPPPEYEIWDDTVGKISAILDS